MDSAARFEALLARRAVNRTADDPLFRPVDADDFREHGKRDVFDAAHADARLIKIPEHVHAGANLRDAGQVGFGDRGRARAQAHD